MKLPLIFIIATFPLFVFAQKESSFPKFGKVKAADLQKKFYSIDSNANAVVLSDVGETMVEGNSNGWFSIVTKRHRVVHILNKIGYDLANVQISLYSNSDNEEKVTRLKAVTYNLENGKVVESDLGKSSIFREKIDKNRTATKFTLPNVKEGSIIEYEYSVHSDFFSMVDPWYFQDTRAPVLWSEYKFGVPQFFTYTFISQGYHPLFLADKKDESTSFNVRDSRGTGLSETTKIDAFVTHYRWVMTDVPELKQESFTSTLSNHISKLEFQFASINWPLPQKDYRNSWIRLTDELMESEYFGRALDKDNGWMRDDLKPILANATSNMDKAKNIYYFIRDNFSCTDHRAIYADQNLKTVLKNKKGNVAEINLLMTALFKHAGLKAEPVILSTTENGYVFELYPMLQRFNYVVTCFTEGGKKYYLDASHRDLGFGYMLPSCYNGHSRLVNHDAEAVNLSADSICESKVTSIFVSNLDNGKWAGSMKQTPGYYESFTLRKQIREKGQEDFFREVSKNFGFDIKINKPAFEFLTSYEQPVEINYEFDLNINGEDLIYVNPLFGEAQKINPFKSEMRYYPVEMPYKIDEVYLLTMNVPAGYTVDEMPKQLRAKLDPEGKSFFEYRISNSGDIISLVSRIKIDRTYYSAEEYEVLREFFKIIVGKHSEQIVFKKKK